MAIDFSPIFSSIPICVSRYHEPLRNGNHNGIDIIPTDNSDWTIYAPIDGLFQTFYDGSCGNGLRIINGTTTVVICHTAKYLIASNTKIKRGDKIAIMGTTGNSTGPHVHFALFVNGVDVDPTSVTFSKLSVALGGSGKPEIGKSLPNKPIIQKKNDNDYWMHDFSQKVANHNRRQKQENYYIDKIIEDARRRRFEKKDETMNPLLKVLLITGGLTFGAYILYQLFKR
jgi:murein DD-endopeptidase MepM/ murein hydrolase activator NlpD